MSQVTASDGRKTAVLLSPKGQAASAGGPAGGDEGRQLAGIQDGGEEFGHAESGTLHARAFTEPQIHAWYQLTDTGLVKPLNNEARTGLQGRNSLPLAAYQRLVHQRYGDKLPGSEHDRKGLADGYAGLTTAEGTASSKAVDPAPSADASRQLTGIAGAVGLVAVTAVGGAIYIRRRRTATVR